MPTKRSSQRNHGSTIPSKSALTPRGADAIIRAAGLDGFGGNCGRVAIAINRVVFGGKGRYVVATNPAISRHLGRMFMGHVVVEWKGRLFDATGAVDDELGVEAWGMVDHHDPDYDYLTEEEALDGQLHYIDDAYPDLASQERAIEGSTRGRCPLRDVERSLRKALSAAKEDRRA